MAQCEWSGMVWDWSPGSALPISSLSGKRSVSVERNEDKEGKPATQTVALDLMTLDVSYTVHRSATGKDPRGEYGKWWNLVGTYAPFFIGGRAYMAQLFMLKEADCSDAEIDRDGNFLSLTIDLKFEEYSEDASGLKATKGAAISLKPGVMQPTAASAVSVGPSDAQKAGKMPANPGM